MAEQIHIALTARKGTGSAESRRVREAGRVPGVLSGHGEPLAVSADMIAFAKAVPPAQYGAAIIEITLDGEPAGSALVKGVQVHTLSRRLLSMELQRVTGEERIQVSVPVVLDGTPPVGAVLEQLLHNVSLRCRADAVPQTLTFDIGSLAVGDVLHAAQLALPIGGELLINPDELIAIIVGPTVSEEEEPVVTEAVAGPELSGDKQKTGAEEK